MKNLCILSLFFIFGCQNTVKENIKSEEFSFEEVVAKNDAGAEEAKKWLEKVSPNILKLTFPNRIK